MLNTVTTILVKDLHKNIISILIDNADILDAEIVKELNSIYSLPEYIKYFESLSKIYNITIQDLQRLLESINVETLITVVREELALVKTSKNISYSQEDLSNVYWRLHNLYYVLNDRAQLIKFQPNIVQLNFLKQLHNKTIVLKARQLGLTTVTALLALDATLFTANYNAVLIMQDLQSAREVKRLKITLPYSLLPQEIADYFKSKEVKNNVSELEFSNNSKISVAASARSGTVQFLHVSEYGILCNTAPIKADELVTGSLPTVHKEGIIVIESTAKGRNDFYVRYMSATEQPNSAAEYKKIFFAWWHDAKYVEECMPNLTQEQIKYLADYISNLKSLNIHLTDYQINFWAVKYKELGDAVFSEFPSTEEEAFRTSNKGAYFTKELQNLYNTKQIMTCFDERLPIYTGWDLGISDLTVCLFFHYDKGKFYFFEEFSTSGKSHIDCVNEVLAKYNMIKYNYYPHDAKHREKTTGMSLYRQITNKYKNYHVYAVPRINVKMNAVTLVREQLKHCYISPFCSKLLEAIENYKPEQRKDREGNIVGTKPEHHSVYSHYYDAFETCIRGVLATHQVNKYQQHFLRA